VYTYILHRCNVLLDSGDTHLRHQHRPACRRVHAAPQSQRLRTQAYHAKPFSSRRRASNSREAASQSRSAAPDAALPAAAVETYRHPRCASTRAPYSDFIRTSLRNDLSCVGLALLLLTHSLMTSSGSTWPPVTSPPKVNVVDVSASDSHNDDDGHNRTPPTAAMFDLLYSRSHHHHHQFPQSVEITTAAHHLRCLPRRQSEQSYPIPRSSSELVVSQPSGRRNTAL